MGGVTRRRVLTATGLVATGSAAGCLGSNAAGAPDTTATTRVQASFVVLGDYCAHIAGEAAAVDTLVPIGQHGHGWEPGPDLQRDVHTADAFVYNGAGFQPWADNLVEALEHDAPHATVINARDGIDLLPLTDDDRHAEDQTHAADHAPGEVDPHYWLDPRRARTAVTTLKTGLTDAVPDHATTISANTDAYLDRLDTLHDTLTAELETRTRNTVLIAGHNSFRYLGDRYGFDIHALAGASPDDRPTPRDITRAQTLITEHDIDTILAPVFESNRAARLLVDETPATEIRQVTPIPTLTEAWADRGWGYVDIMREINIPAFKAALGGA